MLDYMNFFLYGDGNFVQSFLQLVFCVLTAAADYTLAWLWMPATRVQQPGSGCFPSEWSQHGGIWCISSWANEFFRWTTHLWWKWYPITNTLIFTVPPSWAQWHDANKLHATWKWQELGRNDDGRIHGSQFLTRNVPTNPIQFKLFFPWSGLAHNSRDILEEEGGGFQKIKKIEQVGKEVEFTTLQFGLALSSHAMHAWSSQNLLLLLKWTRPCESKPGDIGAAPQGKCYMIVGCTYGAANQSLLQHDTELLRDSFL